MKFFKGAGFSLDVATRHAVVFSNNRIQPDMLPDLDKPSLKEMGITLMGDMIAILRHAKKIVEETTCERFLVDSNDIIPSAKAPSKPVVPTQKKVVTKVAPKVVAVTKSQVQVPVKKVASKSVMVKKKVLPTRTVTQTPEKVKAPIKRKIEVDTVQIDSEEDDYSRKRAKVTKEESVGYKVIMPKGSTARSQTILKKANEQKRTVFDRLGDSSVTSTTSSTEGSTTFNITGLGKPVFKRGNNVFNRLGDKDSKKEEQPFGGILNNGSTAPSHGILKNNRPVVVSTTSKVIKKPVGTMRADFERKTKVAVTAGVKQLVTSTKLGN